MAAGVAKPPNRIIGIAGNVVIYSERVEVKTSHHQLVLCVQTNFSQRGNIGSWFGAKQFS